jgi:hypothetical protein
MATSEGLQHPPVPEPTLFRDPIYPKVDISIAVNTLCAAVSAVIFVIFLKYSKLN